MFIQNSTGTIKIGLTKPICSSYFNCTPAETGFASPILIVLVLFPLKVFIKLHHLELSLPLPLIWQPLHLHWKMKVNILIIFNLKFLIIGMI